MKHMIDRSIICFKGLEERFDFVGVQRVAKHFHAFDEERARNRSPFELLFDRLKLRREVSKNDREKSPDSSAKASQCWLMLDGENGDPNPQIMEENFSLEMPFGRIPEILSLRQQRVDQPVVVRDQRRL
jgi:hypothetical protein